MRDLITALEESTPEFASELLKQLGGRRFTAMTGARNIMYDTKKKSVSMKFGKVAKGKSNHVKITLDPSDNGYDMEFGYVRGTTFKVMKKLDNVPPANLQRTITQYTGLDTHL